MWTLHVLSVNKMPLTETGKATVMTIVGVQAVLAPFSGAEMTGGHPGSSSPVSSCTTNYIIFVKTIYIYL